MQPLHAVALAKGAAKLAEKQPIPVGTHPVDVTLTVRIVGTVTQREGTEYSPPPNWKQALALGLQAAGELAAKNAYTACRAAGLDDKTAAQISSTAALGRNACRAVATDTLLAMAAGVNETQDLLDRVNDLDAIQEQLKAAAPKQARSGACQASIVLTEIVPIVAAIAA